MLGPLLISSENDVLKNWICLYTCVNVRAVHLELIEDMTTESFLLCLRRFIARRGKPSMIISDNASQFKLSNSVINKIWGRIATDEDVQSYVNNEGIEWKHIVEYAPWMGGFYERLVGLTKRSLRKSLGRCKITRQKLMTLIAEVEAVLNSRPLVYLDDDVNSNRALTPAHFLAINDKVGCPDIDEIHNYPVVSSSETLIETWRKGQKYLDNFWKIWRNEYMQSLRERYSYQMKPVKGEIIRTPKIGEIVLIKDEDLPRGSWKLGKITGLISNSIDDIVRAACIITTSGKKLKRPLRLLYPLEGSELDIEFEAMEKERSSCTSQSRVIERPRRKAAVRAREAMKNMKDFDDGSVDDIDSEF